MALVKIAGGEERSGLMTIAEAAKSLGVTTTTLRNWDRAGKLTAKRHPINRYRLYRAEEIWALKKEIEGY